MNTSKHRITRPRGNVESHTTATGEVYLLGHVYTWFGIVHVYSEITIPSTQITFVYKGHEYTRYLDRCSSARYLVTLADRFAHEVTNEMDYGR